MTIVHKATYIFNTIPVKLPMAFFMEPEQKNLKICIETQKTPNIQNNLEKEKQSWRNQASWSTDYTAKLKWSKQFATGTKIEI